MLSLDQHQEFLSKLQQSMIPFFFTETKKGDVYGPFLFLPENIQIAALDTLFYFPKWMDKWVAAIVRCGHSLLLSTHVQRRLLHMCAQRQFDVERNCSLDMDLYAGVICTLSVIGYGNFEVERFKNDSAVSMEKGLNVKIENAKSLVQLDTNVDLPTISEYLERRLELLDTAIHTLGPISEWIIDVIFDFMVR